MKKVIIYLVVLILAVTALGVAIYIFNKEDTPNTPITPTQETCVLTLKVNDSTLGKCITPSGVYIKNREVELKASAINNSEFMGWYIDDELISTEQNFNFMLKTDTLIVAKFKGESMYTKAELEELIKLIDLTQDFKDVCLTYTRNFAEINIVLSFERNSNVYPNFIDYLPENLTIKAYNQIEVLFDINKNFKNAYLHCYDEDSQIKNEISLMDLNNLLKKIPFNKELFTNFVAVSDNPIVDILNILENSYTQNEEKILNISSVYQIEVDDSIPVYDVEAPVLLNAEFINVVAIYNVDDTIPKDPNLDEDGDYVINATELFELKGGLTYYLNENTCQNSLYFPVIESPYHDDTRRIFYDMTLGTIYKADEWYWSSFKNAILELNFNDSSKIQKVELKSDLNTTLNNLKSIYTNKAKQINNETASADEYGQIRGTCVINLASLFNFYDISGNLITNVKFNVSVSYTINRGGG